MYVDDVFFNVLLNSNNGAGYPWQFLWPGEGELPQPAAVSVATAHAACLTLVLLQRRVRAWNNIYTSGFRGISVQVCNVCRRNAAEYGGSLQQNRGCTTLPRWRPARAPTSKLSVVFVARCVAGAQRCTPHSCRTSTRIKTFWARRHKLWWRTTL